MEKRRRFYFILRNIDYSTSALFLETGFVTIQGIYWNWKMSHCFVCCNFQKTVLIRSAEGKERGFSILHMLRIHNGLRKSSKKNVYDLHLKQMNPFEIVKPWNIIARRKLLFEQYRMALKRDKYYIEVQNDDAIKRNRIFSGFMQRTFNRLDILYLHENFFW